MLLASQYAWRAFTAPEFRFQGCWEGRWGQICRSRCSTSPAAYTESDWQCFRGCAISSSHGRPQDFFQGEGANSGMQKVDSLFLVVTFKTQVFTVARPILMHKTLYNISRERGQVPSKHFIFSKGALVFVVPVFGHSGQSKPVPTLLSAYRPNHSTETAVICILNDPISAIDQGHIGVLMQLLDLTVAFDTVDHQILADVLRRRFGIEGDALDWMVNVLTDRSQVVRVGSCESGVITLQFGVLGPKRFLEYAEDICPLLKRLQYHLFTGDMQCLKHDLPTDVPQNVSTLTDCAIDVIVWCAAKRLQLNADKTELVTWFGSAAKLGKIPPASSKWNEMKWKVQWFKVRSKTDLEPA